MVINLADTHLLKVTVSNSEHRGKDISDMIDSMLAKNFFRKSEMEPLQKDNSLEGLPKGR